MSGIVTTDLRNIRPPLRVARIFGGTWSWKCRVHNVLALVPGGHQEAIAKALEHCCRGKS